MAETGQDGARLSTDEIRGYGLGFAGQLRLMLGAFRDSPDRVRILALAAALLAVILATTYAQYRLNQWNVPFFNALERRDVPAFLEQLQVFAIIGGSLLVLNVVQAWLNQMTALFMRAGLARDLVDEWLKPGRALKLSHLGTIGVNPDQRLHEDARNLAEMTTALAIGLVSSTILLASFIGVLWTISESFAFTVGGDRIVIPGYMVWAALIYAGAASALSNLVGARLPALNAERYSKEAELRFTLMRTNEHLSGIALARGEENERRRIHGAITTVLKVIRSLAIGYTNLTWVSAGFGWLSTVAPILIAAPVYFAGELSFGGLMMAVGAFNQVNAALRWYVDNFRQIADWKAALLRVSTFRNALRMMDSAAASHELVYGTSKDGAITVRNLELLAQPPGSAGNRGLRLPGDELVIRTGERVMINGNAGADRRLLFHALAGMWEWGKGEILLPDERIAFLPQKAYFPSATLREVLAYPADPAEFGDSRLSAVMESVGLLHLCSRLCERERWDWTLGEDDQARLRIANLMLAEPRWVVMDDILEGLEEDTQEDLSRVLADLTEVALIYIGRSDAYERIVSPRAVHLPALVPAAALSAEPAAAASGFRQTP